MPPTLTLLDQSSLYRTVDAVNEAVFYGRPIPNREARRILTWLETRVGREGAYAKGFAPTARCAVSRATV